MTKKITHVSTTDLRITLDVLKAIHEHMLDRFESTTDDTKRNNYFSDAGTIASAATLAGIYCGFPEQILKQDIQDSLPDSSAYRFASKALSCML